MKKTMKLFGILAIAAITFSCSKETGFTGQSSVKDDTTSASEERNQDPSNYLLSFGASFESLTKASVTSEGVVSFVEGDEVKVVNGAEFQIYRYDGSEFKPVDSAVSLEGTVYVYYPKSAFSDDGATFTMPAYVESLDDLGDKNPMAAVITNDGSNYKAAFKNVCSVLKVSLTGNVDDQEAGKTLSSLTLENTSVPIAANGTYSVSWNDGKPELEASTATEKSMVINSAVVLDPDTASDFFFLLPPTGAMEGMIVTAKLSDNAEYSRSRTASLSLVRNKIITMSYRAGLFYDGAGTNEDPWQIKTADDFKQISKRCASDTEFLDDSYLQVADIAFAAEGKTATIATIGTYNTAPFTGTYNGDGKTLSRFKIAKTNDSSTGLFAYLSGATIENVKIAYSVVNGGDASGILAGRVIGATTIDYCDVSNSTVYGSNAVGGVVAHISGTTLVKNCDIADIVINTTNEISTQANNQAGIVGYSSSAGVELDGENVAIINCSTSGDVTFENDNRKSTDDKVGVNRGGIAGRLNGTGGIKNCTNNAKLSSAVNYVGGIVGLVDRGVTFIKGCKNFGDISGNSRVGGLVGAMDAGVLHSSLNDANVTGAANAVGGAIGLLSSTQANVNVNCCTAKGKVKATQQVGGFVGYFSAKNSSWILNSIANAKVIATDTDGSNSVGGFAGYSRNEVDQKYAIIANCAVYDNVIKALNGNKDFRVGGFVGIQNYITDKKYSSIRICYYQGTGGQVGYGGTENDNSFTKTALNSDGTNIGGFAGYAAGNLATCFTCSTLKKSGTSSGSSFADQDSNFIRGSALNASDMSLSWGGTVTANTKNLGDVLSQAASGLGQQGNYFASPWESYVKQGITYYYPSALKEFGEEYYK